MHKQTQTIAQCGDVAMRVAIVRTATEHARITVADIIMQLDEGKYDTSVTLPGLGYEDLENLSNSFMKAAKHLRELCRDDGAEAEETPAAVPSGRDADVEVCSTALSYLLARAECNTDSIENWPGTMPLANAVVDAVGAKLAAGEKTYGPLKTVAITALQRVFNDRECTPSDNVSWPGMGAVADEMLKVWWHVFEHPPLEEEENTVPVKPAKAPTAKPAPKKPTGKLPWGLAMETAIVRALDNAMKATNYDWREVQGWPGTYHMATTLLDVASQAVQAGMTRNAIKARMRTALRLVMEREAPEYTSVDGWPGIDTLVAAVIDLILNKEK